MCTCTHFFCLDVLTVIWNSAARICTFFCHICATRTDKNKQTIKTTHYFLNLFANSDLWRGIVIQWKTKEIKNENYMQKENTLAQFINQSIGMKVIDRVGQWAHFGFKKWIQMFTTELSKTNNVSRIGAPEKNLKETESRAAVAVVTAAAVLPVQLKYKRSHSHRPACLFP